MKIKANGIMQNYEISGKSGDWLVLIHTTMHNLKTWWNQVPAFSKDYRVLAYDIRGCGQTEWGTEYSNDVMADDLYELMKALKIDQAHLLGWAGGGTIAVSFIIKHPEMAKSLILSNSGGTSITEEKAHWYAELGKIRLEALEKGGILGLCKTFYPPQGYFFSPGFVEKHPDVRKKYESIMLENTVEQLRTYMTRPKQWRGPFDSTKYSKVTCPTLIIVGENDKASGPEVGKLENQWIRGSELKIFPTGHFTQAEKPEEYNKTVLSFLTKVKEKPTKS